MVVAFVSILAFAMGVVVGRDAAGAAVGGPGLGPPYVPTDPANVTLVGAADESTAGALEEVTYPDRLGSGGPLEETLRGLPLYAQEAPERTPDPGAAAMAPAAPLAIEQEAEEAPFSALAAAAGRVGVDETTFGASPSANYPYTVQVAALRSVAAAEELAGRLRANGFPAYVAESAPDGPAAVYRVRVGKYADSAEAERVRQRLEQEEQLTSWITR